MYEIWVQTQDNENRKSNAQMNREVKREVGRSKNFIWEKKCEELYRYICGTGVSEASKTII